VALRWLALENRLSLGVARFLELEQYAAWPGNRPGWIAERLGISRADEERTLRDLKQAGIIRFDGRRCRLDRERSVDTAHDRRAAPRLRAYWTDRARARIAEGGEGLFSYLVFTTDDETLAAIQELRLKFFRELRALVRASPKSRRVAVANVHLFAIDGG
jgi:DNA-binding MarR family transcriptional regulator